MNWSKETVVETFKQIEEKSKTNRKFRDDLIKNPNETIKSLTGLDIPSEMKLHFVEQKLWERTIILPPFEGDELADDQLEQVAGGEAKHPFSDSNKHGNPDEQPEHGLIH